jgi:flagellar hook-length control protein FliK
MAAMAAPDPVEAPRAPAAAPAVVDVAAQPAMREPPRIAAPPEPVAPVVVMAIPSPIAANAPPTTRSFDPTPVSSDPPPPHAAQRDVTPPRSVTRRLVHAKAPRVAPSDDTAAAVERPAPPPKRTARAADPPETNAFTDALGS